MHLGVFRYSGVTLLNLNLQKTALLLYPVDSAYSWGVY